MRSPTPGRGLLAALLSGQFMANMDNAIVNVATPSIGATLQASGAILQLTVSSYVLASATLLITAARLGNALGRRRLFLAGLAIFTVASLLCGIAPDALVLIVARVVQGCGAALMLAQVLGSIQLAFDGTARTRAIGAYTLSLSVSAVIGQILGGALVAANIFGSAWRPIFLINVPLGVLLFVFAARALPPDGSAPVSAPRIDVPGVVLLSVAMVLVVLPLTLGRELQWPLWTMLALAGGALVFTGFVYRQRTAEAPLVRPGLFASPRVSAGLLPLACVRTTYFSLLFVIALYLQDGLGWNALASGLALVAWVAAYGFAGPLYPRLRALAGTRCAPLGGAIMAGAFFAIALATGFGDPPGVTLPAFLALGGFGFGLISTALMSHLTGVVAPEYAADLSGLQATLVPLSAVVGVATFGGFYLSLAGSSGARAAVPAFALVSAAFGLTALAGAAFAGRSVHLA